MTQARMDIRITSKTNQARQDLSTLRHDIAGLRLAMSGSVKIMQETLSSVQTLGKMGAVAFGGVTLATLGSVAAIKEYNSNLNKAAAIAGLNTSEMNKLGESINRVSLLYAQSSTDISAGVVELTKAGLTMQEISQSIDVITQAMLANNMAFDEAAKIAVFAVKQFGKGFEDLPYLFDVLQKVAQETIMDFGDLQQALQYAGSTAVLAGVPFEQLVSIMGTLSQRAMEMGIASRSVNQMMMSLINNADEMQKWIDSMGLGVNVIKDGVLNLDELIRAFSSLDLTMEDLQKSSDIFTVRAMRSWGLLITGADEYRKLLEEDIPESYGVLSDIAEQRTNTIAYKFGQFREILTAPLRSPEYMEEVMNMLDHMIEPLTRLSKVLYSGLWGFLQWTSDNADDIIDMISRIMEIIFDMAEPLYNIGQMFLAFPSSLMKSVITMKMMMSMGFLNFLKMTVNFSMQRAVIMERINQMETQELIIGTNIVTLKEKKNQTAAVALSIESQELRMADLLIAKDRLRVQSNILMAQSYATLAMSMATVATSAYIMGRAMGYDTGTFITTLLGGAMSGGMIGGMVTGGNPVGMVVGGLIGAGISGGVYYAGTTQHEPMPKPDTSMVDKLLNNIQYQNVPQPTYAQPEAGTMTYGGMSPSVTNNIYIDSVYGNDDLEQTLNRALNRSGVGY